MYGIWFFMIFFFYKVFAVFVRILIFLETDFQKSSIKGEIGYSPKWLIFDHFVGLFPFFSKTTMTNLRVNVQSKILSLGSCFVFF